MEVLSSRILIRPIEPERSHHFYRDVLALPVYREFGEGPTAGIVFFMGGGYLEVSGQSPHYPGPNIQLWMQVRNVDTTHAELSNRGVRILRAPVTEPWGLREMWIADPDGIRIAVIEVPDTHPLRRR
jgi:predicted enzyme related to lactoylglutathione lyase